MPQISADGQGVTHVINDQGVVEFDRANNVSRANWSTRIAAVANKFTNVDEKSGKSDTRH